MLAAAEKKPAPRLVRRALGKEPAEGEVAATTVGVVNRFGFRDATNTTGKRPVRATAPRSAPTKAVPTTAAEEVEGKPAAHATLDGSAQPAETSSSAETPIVRDEELASLLNSAERRRSGASGAAARRRRSSTRTPLKGGLMELLTVDENGQLPSGIDSPPPTPIDISSVVVDMFASEVGEANALVNARVRAKKFDYKGIIQQQSEMIVNLKKVLTTMCEKSTEAKERSIEAQESVNTKVQSLALSKKPMREQIVSLSAQLATLRESSAEMIAAHAELQARFDGLTVLHQADKTALGDVAARAEHTEEKLAGERERAGLAEAKLASIRRQLESAETQRTELADKLRVAGLEHEKQLDELRESIERRTEKQRAEHDAVSSELRARCDSATSDNKRLGDELRAISRERTELRATVAAALEAQAASHEAHARLQAASLEAQTRLQAEALEVQTRLQAELTSSADSLAGVRTELGKKEADLSESLRSISRMQTEAIERQAELREQKKELAEKLERATERAVRSEEAAARRARESSLLEAELRVVDVSDAQARRGLVEAEAGRIEAMEHLLVEQSELTKLRQDHAKLTTEARAVSAQRDEQRAEVEATRAREEAARAELATSKGSARDLEVEFRTYKSHCGSTNTEQMAALVKLQRECEALNARFEETRGQLGVREGETHQLHQEVAARAAYVAELESKLLDAEQTRRKLHNTVQELKGNIRVFCRVRPPTDEGGACLELQPDGASVNLSTVSAGEKSARESSYQFSFDKVFAPGTAQQDVFGEVSSLVQSALDGYKVCIFAYGQTGSGKTFTMQGTSDPTNCGIVPRSLKQIFQATRDALAKGWTYTLHASFIEVYNENVRDLLAPPGAPAGAHNIVHDEAFGTVVTDVTRILVSAESQVDELARMAARQRSVGATDMNSTSSRSHAIFMLYLTGTNPVVGHALHGALHLVDLAGSERLSRSNATGVTLKETQAINKSLSALGDVFGAITNRSTHIPFRNSKLTYLMAPCLSGDGKTLMVVNVAPEADNSMESLSSLRFASQVNACEIGRPKRSVKAVESKAAAVEQTDREPRMSISSVASAALSRPATAAARAPVSAAPTAARKAAAPLTAAGAAAAAKRPATAR